MALALRPTIPSQPSTANPLSGGLSDGLAAFISFGNPRGYDAVNQQYAKTASHTLRFVHGDLSADYSGTQQTVFANTGRYSQTGAFTLAAIVDVDTLTNYGYIAACHSSTTTNGWELRLGEAATDGNLVFHRANAGGWKQFKTASTVAPEGSRNLLIAVQISTGNIEDAPTFVVNDTSISAVSGLGIGSGAATASSGDLYLGRRSDGATQLDGAIRAFAIWNRVLSLSELQNWRANCWSPIAKPRLIFIPDAASSGSSGTVNYTNANDTSSASGTTTVVGTSSTTNANDTSSASGTTTVVGSSSTTNANDTSAGTGTTTVTGTVNYTNNNDTCAGSGTAGAITGTVNYTNNNDTAVGTGWAGIVTGTGSPTNANDTSTGEGTTPRARRGAAKPLRKGYIIRGKKYWLTDDELAIMVALELETIKRSDIKVPTKGRIKPIPTATFEMVRAVAKKLDELASIGLDDDEDEEEELLLML